MDIVQREIARPGRGGRPSGRQREAVYRMGPAAHLGFGKGGRSGGSRVTLLISLAGAVFHEVSLLVRRSGAAVFFAGGDSAPDMTLGFVDIQNGFYL